MRNNYFDVLKAFANLDTNISYCQGMNLIVAFLLIACDYDEKNAFFLLVSLFGETERAHPLGILVSVLFAISHLGAGAFEISGATVSELDN